MNDALKEIDIRLERIHSAGLVAIGLAPSALPAAPAFVADSGTVGMILSIILLVICLGIHEAAHAWVAWKCGDSTGKDLGRITVNPIPHIDPFMSILLPAMLYFSHSGFLFGGAKPVPVNFNRLRHPWRDMSLVALAGPASNFLLAVFFLITWKFFVSTGFYNDSAASMDMRQDDLLPSVLATTVKFNILLTVFNLVPIPPLDGSRVMAWILPPSMRETYVRLERFGLFLVFGLVILSPGFNQFLQNTMYWILFGLEKVVSLGGLW